MMSVPSITLRDAPRRDLPEDYYLTNFRALTGFVESTYGEFLSAAEHEWLDAIESCTEPARRLYVRLLGRRGSIFRTARLRYVEIADIDGAVEGRQVRYEPYPIGTGARAFGSRTGSSTSAGRR